MAKTAEGVVEEIKVYEGKGKNNRPYSLYTLVVDGEDYSAGFDEPECSEGDTVKFEYTVETIKEKKRRVVVKDSLEVTKAASKSAKKADKSAASSKSGGGGSSKDEYWAAKEERNIEKDRVLTIVGARNSAIAVVTAAQQAGLLPELASTKTKPGEKLDIFLGYIKEVQDRFIRELTGEDVAALPVESDDDTPTSDDGDDDNDD